MVKNSTGGNKSKGIARKNMVKREAALRVAREEGEVYAQAIKVMGGGIVTALDLSGNRLCCHIRGKMRGRGKRDNFIGPNTWMIVGMWHTTLGSSSGSAATTGGGKSGAARNCDVLEVYSDSDKIRLRNSLTAINWSLFVANDAKLISGGSGDAAAAAGTEFDFTDDATQEYHDILASSASAAAAGSASAAAIVLDADDAIVDIDDI